MGTFQANYTELVALARQLMTVRPHRDAGRDGVTGGRPPRR